MKVVYIFRRRNPRFYSIEIVFERILSVCQGMFLSAKLILPAFGISFRNLFYIYRESRKYTGEIFHVTGDVHYAVFALPRRRTVLTIHDCVFLMQKKGAKRWVLKLCLLDLPVRFCKYITTISEKTKNEIVLNTGCSADKIVVIENPVSNKIIFKEREFNSFCPRILFIGVTPNKNFDRVIGALKKIECILVILGRIDIEQKRLLNENAVNFESYFDLTDEEVSELYYSSDILLYPSLYEGFGLPIIEAFQAGRVVITSDLSPMKDIAEGGACLVDPLSITSISEGVVRVINDKNYRDDLVIAGFNIVKQYEAKNILNKYIGLYNRILCESGISPKF